MANRYFRYRKGDGNEGNFVQGAVILASGDCTYAALRALVVNDYIAGRSRRRWIAKNLEVDGEPEHALACISYGPRGEQAYESAWLTAELEPIDPEDIDTESDEASRLGSGAMVYRVHGGSWLPARPIREVLDKGARDILDAASPLPGSPRAIRQAAEQALYWLEAEKEKPRACLPDEMIRVLRAALGD